MELMNCLKTCHSSRKFKQESIEKEQLEINSYKAEIEKLKKQLEEKNARIDKRTRFYARQMRKPTRYCRMQRNLPTKPSAISTNTDRGRLL